MKKIFILCILSASIVLISGCGTARDVLYFQHADSTNLAGIKHLHDARIMPKDMITIIVSTVTVEAARPFNLAALSPMGTSGGTSGSQYLVNNDGYINFPVIGKIRVVGLTIDQCQDLILDKIKPYISETEKPIVTVTMSSSHILVMGEVGGATTVPIPASGNMNILEVLGNIPITGKHNNVLLVRTDSTGEMTTHRIDLRDMAIVNSPYFYVQQNDILYVEPTKRKIANATISESTTLPLTIVGLATSVVSVASLLYLVFKK